jgi:hypothetical protein
MSSPVKTSMAALPPARALRSNQRATSLSGRHPITCPIPRSPPPSPTALFYAVPARLHPIPGTADAIIFPFSSPFADLHRRGLTKSTGVASGGAAASMAGISVSSTALAGVAVTRVARNIQATSKPGATSGTCSAGWGGGVVLLAVVMRQGGTTPGEKPSFFGTEDPPTLKSLAGLSDCAGNQITPEPQSSTEQLTPEPCLRAPGIGGRTRPPIPGTVERHVTFSAFLRSSCRSP